MLILTRFESNILHLLPIPYRSPHPTTAPILHPKLIFNKCVDIKWKRQQSYFSEQETGMWENINCNNNKEWT